jgi:hypothetical protein
VACLGLLLSCYLALCRNGLMLLDIKAAVLHG